MLKKVKEYVEEHKYEMLGGATVYACLAAGFFIGWKVSERSFANSLEKCCLATPELKPLLEQSMNKVLEMRKG